MRLTDADLRQYQALQEHAVVARRRRTHVELTGDDRASFLHALCTNHITGLPAGKGCEAFFCNAQGRILFFVDLFAQSQALAIETVPDQGPALVAHMDRYLFRERVHLADRSADWDEALVAGPAAEELVRGLTGAPLPDGCGANLEVAVAGGMLSVRRLDAVHARTLAIVGPSNQVAIAVARLEGAGAVPCGGEVLEVARVERGTPEYGRDVTDENLPQEVGRDARAIHFQKGCYLGQETVARIDALGHVNWLLTGMAIEESPEPPAAGAVWTNQGKPLARITSVVYSPRRNGPLALAYLRRGTGAPGDVVQADQGRAILVSLPLA